jgi:hypothetical protein
MDQEDMKIPDFGKALGVCFKLESIDIGGCTHITDETITFMCSGEIEEDGIKSKPGLYELVTIKLNFLVKIMDGSV